MTTTPRLYVRASPTRLASPFVRLSAAALAGGCLSLLVTAARLTPNPTGLGTHEQLGLPPCGFLNTFGIPCMTCGYTTSFSLLTHGQPLAALLNQPAGTLTALAAAVTAWSAGYVAVTGIPAHRLLRSLSGWVCYALPAGILVLGWAYKIATHLATHP